MAVTSEIGFPVTVNGPTLESDSRTVVGLDKVWILSPVPGLKNRRELIPQHCTVLSTRSAQLRPPLTATAVAVVIPVTATAMEESSLVPSPSWPLPLTPQHRTLPLASSAQVLKPSAAMAVTSKRGSGAPAALSPMATPTGFTEKVPAPLAPFPSCPNSFCPQQRIVPSANSTQV